MKNESVHRPMKRKVSLAVPKTVGADTPEPIGPTDPVEIALGQRERETDFSDQGTMTELLAAFTPPEAPAPREEAGPLAHALAAGLVRKALGQSR